MCAGVGDVLRLAGRRVGMSEHRAVVLEVLGPGGEPPYRVRYGDGRETEIRHPGTGRGRAVIVSGLLGRPWGRAVSGVVPGGSGRRVGVLVLLPVGGPDHGR
ncbi:DUF1918 domain-containing protein [Streptomyces sp. NPDC126514]|uniref:DUF1918 domain-containing protein n=1 Tax=Streptomyces sp. NPDC126514 TaxID=3155210 RepID=UPI0033318244